MGTSSKILDPPTKPQPQEATKELEGSLVVAKDGNRVRLLIEDWLPIAEIGIESVRERTPMTPFPAPNRLHVWWARRPLVASRAAVLAGVLASVIRSHDDPAIQER